MARKCFTDGQKEEKNMAIIHPIDGEKGGENYVTNSFD